MIQSKYEKEIKKYIFIAILFGAVVILSIFTTYYFRRKEKVVVTINGETVSLKEFNIMLNKYSTDIKKYFLEEYGIIAGDKDFWNQSYSGEIPLITLKKKTLEEITKIKVQQIYAREKGLIQGIKYESILAEMMKENKKREIIQRKGGVIYGPVQYNEDMYFDYVFSNMVLRLKEKFAKNELIYNENDLRNYYEQNKESIYKNPLIAKTKLITLNYGKPQYKQKASIIMEEIKKGLISRGKIEDLLKKKKTIGLIITLSNLDFNNSYKSEDDIRHSLVDEVQNLFEGEVSNVIDWGNSFYMVQVIEKQDGGYMSYDDVKFDLIDDFIDKKYNEVILDKVKQAKIEINQKVYDNITID